MDDYPYWAHLSLADRLWIAALEAEEAGLAQEFVDAIRSAAEELDCLQRDLPLTTPPLVRQNRPIQLVLRALPGWEVAVQQIDEPLIVFLLDQMQ